MSSLREQKIELYLKRLTAHLFGMPRREKDEIRQEVRLHLEALIATQEYEGKPEEETVEAALHQFGDPREIGKEMARSWWKKRQRQMTAETAAREAAKPVRQRRQERVIRCLHPITIGVSYAGISVWSESTSAVNPFQLWIKLVTFALAFGLIMGFVNAVQPIDREQFLFLSTLQEQEDEAKKRDTDLPQLSALPKNATLYQRLKRRLKLGVSNWARRYGRQLLTEAAQTTPPIDWPKIVASLFWTGIALTALAMLPLDPTIKRVYIPIVLMWRIDAISQLFWRRHMAKRRAARM